MLRFCFKLKAGLQCCTSGAETKFCKTPFDTAGCLVPTLALQHFTRLGRETASQTIPTATNGCGHTATTNADRSSSSSHRRRLDPHNLTHNYYSHHHLYRSCSPPLALPPGSASLARRLAKAADGCRVVVYTTVSFGAGVSLPHPNTRLQLDDGSPSREVMEGIGLGLADDHLYHQDFDHQGLGRRNEVGGGNHEWRVCYILIAGAESADELKRSYGLTEYEGLGDAGGDSISSDLTPWRLVRMKDKKEKKNKQLGHRIQEEEQDDGHRQASRLVKILPHAFFPNATASIFVDWKLQLRQHPLVRKGNETK